MRVLIVDDSIVLRSQISASLKEISGITVVGTASNGKIALQMLQQGSIDLITLDMEMPELNGMETLKAIRKSKFPVKVIMFSSQTIKGAEKALEALREGADDVVAKPAGEQLDFSKAAEAIKSSLVPRILQFQYPDLKVSEDKTKDYLTNYDAKTKSDSKKSKPSKVSLENIKPQIIVIASSTGGPTALEKVFEHVRGPLKSPILIAQHMPPIFTQILAKRIQEITGVPTAEAVDGERVTNEKIYIAPGDYHMSLQKLNDDVYIQLDQGPPRNSVRPAADFLFESTAKIFGKNCLGVVLTGMGEDAAAGSQKIRECGGMVLIQSKESCVVFGMPGAVFNNGDFDEIADLEKISSRLERMLKK